MTWVDRLWEMTPGKPVLNPGSALTKWEKAILLTYAQGGDNYAAAIAAKVSDGVFKGTHQPQLQRKLHAKSAPRIVRRGYITGALEVGYEPGAVLPEGARELLPPELLVIMEMIGDGYSNKEIGEKIGEGEGTVRSRVLKLGQGLMVSRGIGGRSQIVSRGFEFRIFEGGNWVQAKPEDNGR